MAGVGSTTVHVRSCQPSPHCLRRRQSSDEEVLACCAAAAGRHQRCLGADSVCPLNCWLAVQLRQAGTNNAGCWVWWSLKVVLGGPICDTWGRLPDRHTNGGAQVAALRVLSAFGSDAALSGGHSCRAAARTLNGTIAQGFHAGCIWA